MTDFNVTAEKRDDQGKGASRRLRHAGLIPAVVYGADKEPASIQLQHHVFEKQLQDEAFYSHILTLDVAGTSQSVVLKDLQRHPWKNKIMHADFLRIDKSHKLTMHVPLHFINEDTCIGVKQSGGIVNHHITDLEIECFPADLPEYIEVDMISVDEGDILHLSDLTLPEGVAIRSLLQGGEDSLPVASVHKPKAVVEPEEGAAADEAADSDESGDSEE